MLLRQAQAIIHPLHRLEHLERAALAASQGLQERLQGEIQLMDPIAQRPLESQNLPGALHLPLSLNRDLPEPLVHLNGHLLRLVEHIGQVSKLHCQALLHPGAGFGRVLLQTRSCQLEGLRHVLHLLSGDVMVLDRDHDLVEVRDDLLTTLADRRAGVDHGPHQAAHLLQAVPDLMLHGAGLKRQHLAESCLAHDVEELLLSLLGA